MSVKDTLNNDLYKPNLSFLGDLPPLSPTTSTGKINPSASNKASKQMSKLKAMLIGRSVAVCHNIFRNLSI